jgi:HlyD family type I secretion membrane fusion protein
VRLSSGENQLQIVNLHNQQRSDVAKELRDVQTRRFDLIDRIGAARDVLARLNVTAPVAGKIVGLSVHSRGAVVRPGDTLMEIVPRKDALEVEARVRPEDADAVQVGMTARVNFSAYRQRRLPIIAGTVNNISADRLIDPRTGQAYFAAEVTVDRGALKNYEGARIMPGLPVDVAISTGSRTALEYFLEPVTDVFRRGMRER